MSSEVRSLKIQITGFENMSLKFHVNYNGSQFISSQVALFGPPLQEELNMLCMYLYLWGVILKAPFILALTETWISPEDMISLVFLRGYSVFLTCIPGATSLEWRWVIFLYLSHFYSIFLLLPQKQPILKLMPSAYTTCHPDGCSYLQNPESHSPFCDNFGPLSL